MRIHQSLIFFAIISVILLLSGCDSAEIRLLKKTNSELNQDIAWLKKSSSDSQKELESLNRQLENKTEEAAALQKEIKEKSWIERARLAELDDAAAVDVACNVLIPVCPDVVLEPGRKAIAGGASAGRSVYYWILLFGKCAFLVGLLMIPLRFYLGYVLNKYRPMVEAHEEAMQASLNEDEEMEIRRKKHNLELAQMHKDRSAASDEFEKIKTNATAELQALQDEIEDAEQALQAATNKLALIEKTIEDKNSIVSTLGNFKI
jgi:DNA repair exonuclease SbcCD ATPase subunit